MNHRLPALAALSLLTLAGCTTLTATQPDLRDPYERANRATFRFNEALDRSLAKPVARAYQKVTPRFAQQGVSNFMANVGYPTVIVNDFLQAKFREGFSDFGRLLLNSSVGIGGLLDPATAAGLEAHDEDFGQTLGKWGVRSGPYLMLPLLGPSTMRDSFGLIADQATDPRQYINNATIKWSLQALHQVDRRARLLDVDAVLDRASDKYVIVRSAYLQRREYQVMDGNIPDQRPEDMEDPDPGADAPPQTADPSVTGPPATEPPK